MWHLPEGLCGIVAVVICALEHNHRETIRNNSDSLLCCCLHVPSLHLLSNLRPPLLSQAEERGECGDLCICPVIQMHSRI